MAQSGAESSASTTGRLAQWHRPRDGPVSSTEQSTRRRRQTGRRSDWLLAACVTVMVAASLLPCSHAARIINGRTVPEGVMPFVAHLEITASGLACGCTLIAPDFVLTAAHCMRDPDFGRTPPDGFMVVYNSTKGSFDAVVPTRIERQSVRYAVHPKFNSVTMENDIAIIQLAPSSASSAVPFVRVARPTETLGVPGALAVLAGWGYTANGGLFDDTSSPNLLKGDVKVVTEAACGSVWNENGPPIDYGLVVCASTDVSDVCYGDSGGPLFVVAGSTLVQLGVTSFGPEICGNPASYSVYTRVSAYATFICNQTRNLEGSPINRPLCVSGATPTPDTRPAPLRTGTRTPTRVHASPSAPRTSPLPTALRTPVLAQPTPSRTIRTAVPTASTAASRVLTQLPTVTAVETAATRPTAVLTASTATVRVPTLFSTATAVESTPKPTPPLVTTTRPSKPAQTAVIAIETAVWPTPPRVTTARPSSPAQTAVAHPPSATPGQTATQTRGPTRGRAARATSVTDDSTVKRRR